MNVLQSLKSLSGYPIPLATIQDVADEVGISVDVETTQELRGSKEFKRAKARVYLYLSKAPNVSQGGITYSFSDEDRRRFRNEAESILDEIGDDANGLGVTYGYKGEDL